MSNCTYGGILKFNIAGMFSEDLGRCLKLKKNLSVYSFNVDHHKIYIYVKL